MPVIVGKTIDQLNQVTAVTASDELVVYDAESGTGVEPTKKVTGSNLASSVKTLGSLLGTSDVVNDLTSTLTTAPLSAAQGKALYDLLSTDMITNVYGSQPYGISAGGTIGEYLTSQTFTAAQVDGYLVRFVTIENFNHPGNYTLMLSFNMNTGTARVDMYRASTSAINLSNADFTVRFYYVRV